nr:acyl-CoA thioester hydrolase/BAAT C-terminal domain-containing protein [Sinorhizobium meliloti]
MFEQSLQRFASSVPAATIPVEVSQAKIVVIAGGSDALWPLDTFAWSILERRQLFGKDAVLISDPEAGHRILLPGEKRLRGRRCMPTEAAM